MIDVPAESLADSMSAARVHRPIEDGGSQAVRRSWHRGECFEARCCSPHAGIFWDGMIHACTKGRRSVGRGSLEAYTGQGREQERANWGPDGIVQSALFGPTTRCGRDLTVQELMFTGAFPQAGEVCT